MVSIKSLAVATLAAVPAMGWITNLTAPAEAAAGSNITATLQTAINQQNYVDFGVVWGLSTPELAAYPNTVGTQVGYTPLTGKEGLEYPYTFDVEVAIPEGFTGDYVLRAAVPNLSGASGTVKFDLLSANITIS